MNVTPDGLVLSSIYDWFQADFGGSQEAVIAHLLEHAEPGLAGKIRSNPRIAGYHYNWSLNDAAKLKKS